MTEYEWYILYDPINEDLPTDQEMGLRLNGVETFTEAVRRLMEADFITLAKPIYHIWSKILDQGRIVIVGGNHQDAIEFYVTKRSWAEDKEIKIGPCKQLIRDKMEADNV